jgi:hypothetical protein
MAEIPHGKTDADFIQAAYGNELKLLFKVLWSDTGKAKGHLGRFQAGLTNSRTARDNAFKIADLQRLTTAFSTDAELIQEAYGDTLNLLFASFCHNTIGLDEFKEDLEAMRNLRNDVLAWLKTLPV